MCGADRKPEIDPLPPGVFGDAVVEPALCRRSNEIAAGANERLKEFKLDPFSTPRAMKLTEMVLRHSEVATCSISHVPQANHRVGFLRRDRCLDICVERR